MFNERDRRRAAIQLMHSNDPSYDNRTIASTLKMPIRTVQPLRAHWTTLWRWWSMYECVIACMKEDLKCRSYRRQTNQNLTEKTKNLRLIKSVRHPPPPTWTLWTTSFGHTSRTSPTWPLTTPKPAWSPPSTEYSPSSRRRSWKNSGSVSRQWLRLKAATLNRYQLYYIIKLPELIFSIKVLK